MNAHISLVLFALVSAASALTFRAWVACIDGRVPRLAYRVAVTRASNARRHLLSFRASP
ncbi:hypothetical protein [Caballeronia ptereochthonis]|uniref:Uncharacterized protein n=1 Tax=Caballeronia ptereochthonis TaxID=1777144 RepID=A0A157ZN18_9BURK|nr:hypothetical protein [Caballeronia ptereochthonis]SAK46886.1 hypothetical protein AWB83_00773 [Caballeronia ptereochthonis]